MFKYKFIKAKQEQINHPSVNLMPSPSLCLEENVSLNNLYTLTLWSEKEQKVVGSATLAQRDPEYLQEDIRELLPTGPSHPPYVWECSTLSFDQSPLLSFQSSLQENIYRHFYHCLYEGLVAFGKQKQIGFFVVKLTTAAYLPTKEFGLWPYIIELLPSTCRDDLFYGILPLRGGCYEAYKKEREKSE